MLNDINSNKTVYQLLEKLTNNINTTLNCIKIGEIVSFDKADQTCSVRIMHKQTSEYNPFGRELLEYPVLQKVPCVVMGGGSTHITHPISSGDQCLLVFNDYMLDGWWASGEPRPSDFPRQHDISDAIALVGLRALPRAIQNYSDFLDLHYSDNSSIVVGGTIEVNNQTINLNGNTKVTGNAEVTGNTKVGGNEQVTGSVTAQTLNATTAANGSFVSADNKTVTVVNGIVTSIA